MDIYDIFEAIREYGDHCFNFAYFYGSYPEGKKFLTLSQEKFNEIVDMVTELSLTNKN